MQAGGGRLGPPQSGLSSSSQSRCDWLTGQALTRVTPSIPAEERQLAAPGGRRAGHTLLGEPLRRSRLGISSGGGGGGGVGGTAAATATPSAAAAAAAAAPAGAATTAGAIACAGAGAGAAACSAAAAWAGLPDRRGAFKVWNWAGCSLAAGGHNRPLSGSRELHFEAPLRLTAPLPTQVHYVMLQKLQPGRGPGAGRGGAARGGAGRVARQAIAAGHETAIAWAMRAA